MARIVDGTALAAEIKNELKQKITEWINLGHRAPSIRGIIVGDNAANLTYWKQISNETKHFGVSAELTKYNSEITEDELIKNIQELNADTSIDGILLLLPVPENIRERNVCNAIAPSKDVDGFHVLNVGKLCLDMLPVVPATALAVVEILKRSNIETFGRNAVVVSRSKHIGMPLAMILHTDKRHESGLGMDATVTICHRYTPQEDLEFFCRNADIIITATGVPKLIKKNMVKLGAAVIDIGFVGDVDFDEVIKVAGVVTPVRGGVGPITIAMLMHNVLQLAQKTL